MKKSKVWYEMARRKVQFHNNENWDQISLWGLFNLSSIKSLVEKGLLIPHGVYAKRAPGWYRPSKEAWENYIKPLIETHSLEELTRLAGW